MRIPIFLAILLVLVSVSYSMNIPSCGSVGSGSYTLNSSLEGAPISASDISTAYQACLEINSSDVALDCQGNSITDNGTPYSVGIFLDTGLTNVTVDNCRVYDYTDGIYLLESNDNIFANDTSNNNGDGFVIFTGNNNTFTSDTANDLLYGFFFVGATNNTLTGDTAHTNGFSSWAFRSLNESSETGVSVPDTEDIASTGNVVSNLNIGQSTISFTSNDVNIRDRPVMPVLASGSPSIEIDVVSTNQSGLYDSERVVMGISDGNSSDPRDINSVGPIGGDFRNVARQYAFDGAGNPVEFTVPVNITNISANATAVHSYDPNQDDGTSAPIPIGFTVSMYNRLVDTISINSDGFIFLNHGAPNESNIDYCCGAVDLSLVDNQANAYGPDFIVSPDWADLDTTIGTVPPDANVTYGTVGTSPNRVFIVYFFNESECCDNHGFNTFQIKLFENGTASTFSSESLANPPNLMNFGKYIEATANDPDSFLFLNVSYAGSSVNPSTLLIAKYNGSWETNTSDFANAYGVNVSGQYVYANITDFGSIFAPLGVGAVVSPSSGSQVAVRPYMVVSEEQVCPGDGLNVTVTSSSTDSPVSGATVAIYLDGAAVASGTTGPDGTAALNVTTGGYYTIKATSTSYADGTGGFGYAMCAPTQTKCNTDQDCQPTQSCRGGQCMPVSCPNGQIIDHLCQMPQVQNQTNQTQPQCAPPSCCKSDSACDDNQRCLTPAGVSPATGQSGSCTDINGCGTVSNHTLTTYQCGSQPSCPACPAGSICQNNACLQIGLNCPSTAIVNDTETCVATNNSQPLTGCAYSITDPNGKISSGNCDDNGNFQTPPLGTAGEWSITLSENGTAVKTTQILVKAPPPVPATTAPAATSSNSGLLVWALVLVVIVVAVVLYWRSRAKGRK